MRPPVRTTTGPRVDAAEADRIATVYNVRSYPAPPFGLLTEAPRDYEQDEELTRRDAAPHWNSAVDLIRQGVDGYLALVHMRDRLAAHLAELTHQERQVSLPAEIDYVVRRILIYESKRHGPDATLEDSLEGDLPLGDTRWSWELRFSSAQVDGPEVLDEPPALLALRAPEVDRLVAEYEGWDAQSLVEFERGATWAQCIEKQSNGEVWRILGVRGPDPDVVQLVEFRLKVVEQVLREHEVLGHVDEFGAGARRRLAPSSDQTSFLDAAVAAIEAVEAEASDATSAETGRQSWANVSAKMTIATGWSTGRLERFAERDLTLFGGPAFEKREGRGSGPLPRGEEAERYARFCRVVRAYDRARSAIDGLDEG